MVNPIDAARNIEASHLSAEATQQQAAKAAQPKPPSPPEDSVTLKSTGDQNHGDSQ
jgi:hypothetical protein